MKADDHVWRIEVSVGDPVKTHGYDEILRVWTFIHASSEEELLNKARFHLERKIKDLLDMSDESIAGYISRRDQADGVVIR